MVVVVSELSSFFAETVHVKLSDVGVHVPVLEVDRQNITFKLGWICNNKTITIVSPVDRMVQSRVLDKYNNT